MNKKFGDEIDRRRGFSQRIVPKLIALRQIIIVRI